MALRLELSPHLYLNKKELEWRRKQATAFDPEKSARLTVKHIGVWDTVGALGVPNRFRISGLFNRRYRFHDTHLSKTALSARHAVAIDERRLAFSPALWGNLADLNKGSRSKAGRPYQQSWFPGDHSSVGGGGRVSGLALAALEWIVAGAEVEGLEFHQGLIYEYSQRINHLASILSSGPPSWFYSQGPRSGPSRIEDVAPITQRRWADDPGYRPEPLVGVSPVLEDGIKNGAAGDKPVGIRWR